MPKTALTINDFSGGLITDVSPRDIEPNQLQLCTNVDPSSVGRLKMASKFEDDDTNFGDFTSAAHTAGYGLFVFSNDNEVQSGHGANADDFLLKSDGATVDVQELSDKTITADQLGTTSATPAFYAAEGDVFVGGDHSAAPRSLVWHSQVKLDRTVADWISATQAKTAPTEGVDGDMMIHASDSGDASGNTDFTTNEVDKLHWVLDFGADDSGGNFNNDSTAAVVGNYMEFAASWLYKNNAESPLTDLKNGSNDGTYGMDWQHDNNVVVNATLTVHAEVGAAYTAASDHIYGARLYSKQSGENTWYLLADLSFEKGIKGSLETEFTPWKDSEENYGHAAEAAGAECTTNPIVDPPGLLTFKSLNGYDYDDIPANNLVYFKHAAVANSRAYIGDIKVGTRIYGDRILKSAIVSDSAGIPNFNYDVFIESSFIDVAANDGDSITALEAYADRLLEFKKKSLYIINISKELEFLEDVRIGAGVDNPAAVTKTPFGVFWANQTGCFLYDGESITQLHMGKISDSDWASVTSSVIVGYDLPSRQVIILWDGSSSGSGNAFVYALDTQSWHKVTDMLTQSQHATNMVNTSDGELVIGGGSTNGEVSSYGVRLLDQSNFDMRTGQLSLGNPGSKKNLLNVKVRYKNSGSGLKVNILVDDAAASIGEDEIALGTLTNNTSGSIVTKEFDTSAIATLKGQYWFIVQIEDEESTGTTHKSFELDEVVLTYRDLGVR